MAALSWLSFSCSRFSFTGYPTRVVEPDPPVSRSGTPHASRVTRTLRDLHPSCLAAVALVPPDGIFTRFASHRPVRRCAAEGVSWSPPFRGRESLGRTVRLFRCVTAVGVCRTEPPSHWANLSPGTQRYEPALTRRLVTASLRRLVADCRAVPAIDVAVSGASCVHFRPQNVVLRGQCRSFTGPNPHRRCRSRDRVPTGRPRRASRRAAVRFFGRGPARRSSRARRPLPRQPADASPTTPEQHGHHGVSRKAARRV